MPVIKYQFEVAGVDDIAKQFRDIALVSRHPSPIRRAWLWCKHRPWMMFIIGQALVAVSRLIP